MDPTLIEPTLLAALLSPINETAPAGHDLTYSSCFDDIREARRADDPSLAQGDWETVVKVAEWPKVRNLCERALRTESKDFQLAIWYCEAQTRLHGFAGAAFGFDLLAGLLERYWEQAYPELDPHDLDERLSKFEWLNRQLPQTLGEVALTSREQGSYHRLDWEAAQAIENQSLKDPEVREKAERAGKVSMDTFERAALGSGRSYYQQLTDQLQAALAAADRLDSMVEQRFGEQAPSLRDIREALGASAEVAERLLHKLGGPMQQAPTEHNEPAAANTARKEPTFTMPTDIPALQPPRQPVGPIRDRREAVQRLREVADYFRMYEPHSPVAHLAERTAKWAEMSLEQWLSSVIKDDSTLRQLHELLDVPPGA
jgi:type VI secretion system protein ImpA